MTHRPKRRTIRRYAHELFPHPDEGESRPLETEIKYLYAQWIGHGLFETDWFILGDYGDPVKRRLAATRTAQMIWLQRLALAADALIQGITGQEAWDWMVRHLDIEGEITHERARKYLADAEIDSIKPYPVLEEPTSHNHLDPETRVVTRAEGRESDCEECTEPAL